MRSVTWWCLAAIALPTGLISPNSIRRVTVPEDRAERFGVYNWNIDDRTFPGGNLDRLNWGANTVAQTGTRTIRVFLGPRDIYRLNPSGVSELSLLAATPAYAKLFTDPRFSTYLLTAYTYSSVANRWSDGFTAAEYALERAEIRRLGEYLLSNTAFTGKTFILLNWEGDNEMRDFADKESIWSSYRDSTEARADGVRDARAAVPASTTKIHSGLEFNFIRRAGTLQICGTPVADTVNQDPLANRCVIDFVAPRVSVDYYSYSAWQTLDSVYFDPSLNIATELQREMRLAVSLVRATRPQIAEANFILGEFGFERVRFGECRVSSLLHQVLGALEGENGLGVSYAIFWQIIDNANLYGVINDRFGLYRTAASGLVKTRVGVAFERAMNGQGYDTSVACPTIQQPPPAWGIVDAATGEARFRLDPDSVLRIRSDSPFSSSSNTVNVAQSGLKFALTSASGGSFAESATQITTQLPSGRRPGETWVYVTNADGHDSNAQIIDLECPSCPDIKPICGVVENAYYTDGAFSPGSIISIRGAFSSQGNTVVVVQTVGGGVTQTSVVEGDSILSQSLTEIMAKLPANLNRNSDAGVFVIDASGRRSIIRPIFIDDCINCAPALGRCQPILNGDREEFHPGTRMSMRGRFRTTGNRVVVEQWDAAGIATRYQLDSQSPGWKESETEIEVGLPAQVRPGRALVYIVDPSSKESGASDITITTTTLAVVSAASFKISSMTPGGIMAAFGNALGTTTASAQTIPLPAELGGTRVVIRDAGGTEHVAPLFFVSRQQVNFQIPESVPLGVASVTITSGDGSISTASGMVVPVAPGIFTANADGKGAAAAYALRVASDGMQVYEPTATFDLGTGKFITAPLVFGPETEELFLVLFGTGLRNRTALDQVSVTVGGTPCVVTYAGVQKGFVGLDQINARLPRTLASRGEVDVVVRVDNHTANTVFVRFQ